MAKKGKMGYLKKKKKGNFFFLKKKFEKEN